MRSFYKFLGKTPLSIRGGIRVITDVMKTRPYPVQAKQFLPKLVVLYFNNRFLAKRPF